jgi:hypothetical protein
MTRLHRITLTGQGRAAAEGTRDLATELEAALASLRSQGRRSTKVVVAVCSPPLQKRRLHGIPKVSPAVLRSMIGHQAHRFFRPAEGGLVVDAVWQERRGPSPEAIAVAVDRNLVTAITETCSGGTIELVDIIPDESKLPRSLSLLPEEERRSRRRREWSRVAWFAKVTGLLWCAMVGIGIARERVGHALTASRLARLQEPAARVIAVRRTMDSVGEMVHAVAKARERRLAMAGILGNLATALPDSSVLSSVNLSQDGTAEIIGLAMDPMRVLAGLQAKQVGKVEFVREPLVEPSSGREWSRFVIRLGTGTAR